ncbi:MAG TPA: alpha/beta fold hydrolase [Burkholderiales bacterium]|nr:alpha/beta fold hydrolase [Burkholderiales bacterium]
MTVPAHVAQGAGDRILVFLHGVGGGHAAWRDQLAYFSARGLRAVAWDQPGYGGSPLVEPYDFEHIADALRDLIEHLGGAPVVLVGHSMGGFVAQEAYARFPELVRALVLAFTSPAFGGVGGEFQRAFIAERIGPLDAGQTMADVAARLMPGMRGAASKPGGLQHAERVMAGVPPATYRKAVALVTTFDRRALLPAIAVPTLLVAGAEDRTAPAAVMQRMALKIPGAEFALLARCGHLGPMDQPDEFNPVLEDFLERRILQGK